MGEYFEGIDSPEKITLRKLSGLTRKQEHTANFLSGKYIDE